ncbi:hypothetical protein niasHT_021199 [Heterodera trifolii]|uniref:SKI/SNO/DAC domain-containing protein n=1 Tax=Heterodera trifolii TaxID=157864 RepID=A0ABD2KRR3_9BILA
MIYELFLKQFVGGLHTVYTKLKRLGIQPLICSVEQVRALRNLGAIQSGVNRCKLIETDDFETLYRVNKCRLWPTALLYITSAADCCTSLLLLLLNSLRPCDGAQRMATATVAAVAAIFAKKIRNRMNDL